MASKIENCEGSIKKFYDNDTGSVSYFSTTTYFDFYEPGAMQKFKEGDLVTYVTVSEPPKGRRIVKNVVRK
jgi:hypothetical protein